MLAGEGACHSVPLSSCPFAQKVVPGIRVQEYKGCRCGDCGGRSPIEQRVESAIYCNNNTGLRILSRVAVLAASELAQVR
jgi:hypothetical protein